jgi:hypothetical protein
MGGPELELGVTRRTKFDEIFGPPVVHFHASDHLRVAAIQVFREAKKRREGPNDIAGF